MRTPIQPFVVLLIFGLAVGGGEFLPPQKVWAGYHVLHNLKLEHTQLQIDLMGDYQPGWREALYRRAKDVLAAAKFHLAPANFGSTGMIEKGETLLDIRVMAINLQEGSQYAEIVLGGTCKGEGTWLFDGRMELWEWTESPRNPNSFFYSSVWKVYRPAPIIKDHITYEELERELVGMLQTFISEYNLSNPSLSH